MASVRLYRDETEDFDLPAVCMKCGAPATAWKTKTFSWHPPWVLVLILVGLLPYAVVAMALTKRRTVRVPLCAAHKGHWLWRQLLVIGSFFALLLAGGVAFAILIEADGRRGAGSDLAGFLCFGVLGGLLLWVVLAAVAQVTSIRPSDITDRWIVLTGVSPEFREVVAEDRERYEEEREEREAERRRARRRLKPPRSGELEELEE